MPAEGDEAPVLKAALEGWSEDAPPPPPQPSITVATPLLSVLNPSEAGGGASFGMAGAEEGAAVKVSIGAKADDSLAPEAADVAVTTADRRKEAKVGSPSSSDSGMEVTGRPLWGGGPIEEDSDTGGAEDFCPSGRGAEERLAEWRGWGKVCRGAGRSSNSDLKTGRTEL